MGEIIARKHVELIQIIDKPILLHLVGVYIIVSAMHVHTSIKRNVVMEKVGEDQVTDRVRN